MQSFILGAILSAVLAAYPISMGKTAAIEKPEPAGTGLLNVAEAAEFKSHKAWVTAYSSTPDETDSSPLTTANGTRVHDGVLATNIFPFGALVKIPQYFGDKIFMVEDRMHHRKTNFVDVWMPSKEAAQEFGIHYTEILVLE